AGAAARDLGLPPLGAHRGPVRARADPRRGGVRARLPAARTGQPLRPRPSAASVPAAVHASDAAGADRGSQNGLVTHTHVHTSARGRLAGGLALIFGLMVGDFVFVVVVGILSLLAVWAT